MHGERLFYYRFVFTFKESLKASDMGLLMGAPILNNILAQFSTVLHRKIVMEEEKEESFESTEPKVRVYYDVLSSQ